MSRTALVCLASLFAIACEPVEPADGLPNNEPWTGESVQYVCFYGDVDYTYASQLPGVAHPAVDGCYDLPAPFTYPWNADPAAWANTMYDLCVDECHVQVAEEAAGLGRVVLGDTCYELEDTDYTWTLANCDSTAQSKLETQDLELTYAPAVGSPVSVAGVLSYGIESGKTGDTLSLAKVSLFKPLEIVTGLKDATVLLGYPEGTVISLDQVVLSPIGVALDSRGAGQIEARELSLLVGVSVTEPDAKPEVLSLRASVPFDIEVDFGRTVGFGSWDDGFGGTFSIK